MMMMMMMMIMMMIYCFFDLVTLSYFDLGERDHAMRDGVVMTVTMMITMMMTMMFYCFFDLTTLSYFDFDEYHRANGIMSEGVVMTAKATQSRI